MKKKTPVLDMDEDIPAPVAPPVEEPHWPEDAQPVNGVELPAPAPAWRSRGANPTRWLPPPAVGRTLPHSIEAEEHLLSCLFLDGADILAKCQAAGLTAESFYDSKHGLIYGLLCGLQKAGKPLEVSVVAEELKSARKLDQVGGYSFLVQVSSRIPTTAQAGFFIEKVREQSLLREVIRSATTTVEDCYSFSGGIDEFLAEQAGKFVRVTTGGSLEPEQPVPLTAFQVPPEGDASILLGNRFLCRGDGAVLVGTSGMGKSSMSIQMATGWALGQAVFGIKPAGPLRSLIIQSEDSDGDVAEMWASMQHALKLTAAEIAAVTERVLVRTERVLRGDRFMASLRRLITKHKPDLVWLNPLQAFIDGDVTDSQDLGRFLREGLNSANPGLFGYVIVHHTTKPATGKDRSDRLWHEVMYDMAGGAEIINWARAIMSLRAATEEGQFNLVLAKRGRRAGVTKSVAQGAGFRDEPVTTLPLAHAKGFIKGNLLGLKKDLPLIHWETREPDAGSPESTAKGGRPEKYSFDDYRNLFPAHSEPGLEIAPLHKRLETNAPITKASLHNCLKRWAEDGLIEVIKPAGHPMRYRLLV
jgi:hypothetical protein